jgi:hypothetical protein
MHKAKTFKPLISFLAIFALLFSGAVVSLAPANAAVSNGCISSGFQPQNCDSERTAISNIAVVAPAVGTTSATVSGPCLTPTFTLNLVVTSGGGSLTPVTGTVAGMTFAASGTTATLSGATTGTWATSNYIILATCANSSQEAFSFSVTVTASASPAISPSTRTITGTVQTALASQSAYTASNFTPTSYSITSGTLPAGLAFDTTTGLFSGTPTATSAAVLVVTATDSAGTPNTATSTITFAIETAVVIQSTPEPAPEPSRKVTICHRTHSETNPYVRITVDYNSVNKKSGHQGHDEIYAGEHVFKAGIYKRAKDKLWGDIIPADPSGLNRWQPLNMTTLGAQIYAGTVAGCPSYNPVTYYNNLRESGVPEKQIKAEMAELETEQAEAEPSIKKTDAKELKYTGSSAKALEEENDKVTICHATNATTNPYRKITVSTSSITNKAGHYSHDDIYMTHHVYDASVNYPANKKDWGDIIPADPTGKNRWKALNWTALGQDIYNGVVAGCAEQTTQEVFNVLREAGLTKKEVKADLEKQSNIDDDPKDVDGIKYDGKDPEVEKTEPKEPVVPPGKTIVDQTLSGIVWLDLNRDGLKDSDEPFMKNIPVTVTQLTSVASASASVRFRTAASFNKAAVVTVNTDENGFYIFPSLGAGDWKATAGVPTGLEVTYDSQGSHEGEVVARVPVSGAAFTWVGLVSETAAGNTKLLEKILTENPNALPISELPAALQVKVKKVLADIEAAKNPVASEGQLAFTGTNQMAWLFFGLLLLAAGLISLGATRLARQKK